MKALISLIFIAAIVVLGIMIGRGNPTPKLSPSPTTEESTVSSPESSPANTSSPDTAQGGSAPSGTLFALVEEDGDRKIQAIDIVSKNKKTIYTDKGEELKLKLVSHVTRGGDSIIAVMGKTDDQAGQLVALSTDGKGTRTVLADNFITTNPPVVSPDKTKLAMTVFSNAEPNFGFTLTFMDIDGKNQKDLITDSSGISNIAFSPDGKQLAFTKGASSTSSEVVVISVDSKETKTLYQVKDKVIEDFDWSSVGLLAITAAPSGKKAASQSEVFLIDPKNKDALVQLTKNSLPERSPQIAPDASGIAFIQSKSDKPQDNLRAGDITVVRANGTEPAVLGSAVSLLGWTK